MLARISSAELTEWLELLDIEAEEQRKAIDEMKSRARRR